MKTENSNVKCQNHSLDLKSNIRYRAYKFSLDIINLVKQFPEKRVYWVIGDQLLRSATSIGANLIEAKAASSKRDFIKFYEIALKSGNETIYWLYLLRDSSLTENSELERLIKETKEITNMLGSSLLTMKKKKD
ncbi:MAG: four helix bundle protein [Patescibacteria group bacterium]|nr:four helix bundle protein [Patescibacteria group bacterium]